MALDPIVSALLVVSFGLIIAIAGYHLFKGLVGLMGAIILGGAAFFFGLWIGGFVAGGFGLIIAIVLGIIGAVIGAILAIAIATVVLAIGFGIVAFSAGVALGESLDLPGIGPVALGAALAVIGAFLFLILARFLIRAATSLLGGFMVASGSFYLFDRFTTLSDGTAFLICIAVLAVVSVLGFYVQSGAERKDGSKPGKRRDGAHRDRRKKR
jgi:hypothetical protein